MVLLVLKVILDYRKYKQVKAYKTKNYYKADGTIAKAMQEEIGILTIKMLTITTHFPMTINGIGIPGPQEASIL